VLVLALLIWGLTRVLDGGSGGVAEHPPAPAAAAPR